MPGTTVFIMSSSTASGTGKYGIAFLMKLSAVAASLFLFFSSMSLPIGSVMVAAILAKEAIEDTLESMDLKEF